MSTQRLLELVLFVSLIAAPAAPARAQQPSDSPAAGREGSLMAGQEAVAAAAPAVPGATNFIRLDSNFASGGVTTPEAFALLKQQGYRTVINLRTASEQDANIEAEGEAVRKLGLAYLSLPFSPSSPDVAMVDKFLEAVKVTSSQPVYIHCRSGARANAFWLIKRVLVDKWTVEKALAESDTLKLTNEQLRKFALAYIDDHK